MKKTILQKAAALAPLLLLLLTAITYAQPSVSLTGVDPSCGNFANGSITATGSGGWGPYDFTFSNGATFTQMTTVTVSGLAAGTYGVTVVDMDLGIAEGSITLNGSGNLDATVTQSGTCDPDDNDGDDNDNSASVSVSGGSGNYTYAWSNGASTASVNNLPAGLACVTVSDGGGCSTVACANIAAPLSVSATASSLQCADFCDASVTATVSGGTGPYTYVWNTGATGEVLMNVGVGTYTVTVTDANGCTATASATVSAPNPIMISVNVNNPSCNGGATGSATVMVVGGSGGPFTYEFSDGQTTQTAVNLAPGSYSVTVRGPDGCDASANFTIGTSGNTQATVATTDATCADPTGGTATVTATGGAGNYSYAWSNGANGTTITGLSAGTYSVTVTDNDTGCVAVAMGTVMSSDGPTITTSTMNVVCNGDSTGMGAVMVSGGTQPYTFSWSNGTDQPSINNVTAGTYGITVTDANGCSATASVTVTQPDAINVSVSSTSPDCTTSGGSATASAAGGTAPYTYSWSNGANSATINNVNAGTYSVTVTDANGCTATGSTTITPGGGNLTVTTSGGDAVCDGAATGTLTATATGGSGNYTYSWSNGASTQTINGLAAGSYSVTVTDNDTNCSGTATATIGSAGSLEVDATGTDFCVSDANGGSATVSATGGSGNYSYSWSSGASTQTISGIAAGTYTVTVTDNTTGCTGTASATVSANPDPSVMASIATPLTTFGVNDGAVTATTTSGTAPYTYSWSTGANTQTITGLGAGTYTVTVTDANGCTDVDSVVLQGIAKVGGRAFRDNNGNGQRDNNDLGLGNIDVTLSGTDLDGNAVTRTATTDANGQYVFDGLPAGSYQVAFGNNGTDLFTTANTGNDDFDSDANASTGTTNTFTVNVGDCILTIDAGYVSKCDNFVTGGEICCDQVLCGPGNNPDVLTETVAPQGGSGAIEYLWMSTTDDVPFSSGQFSAIPGATGSSYDPPVLNETTYFVRCVRRECCTAYQESNIVTISVDGPDAASIIGSADVCTNEPTTFSAGAVNSPNASYSWNFGLNATPATSSDASVNVTYTTFGVRNVTLTVVAGGCTSTATLQIFVSDNSPNCVNNLQSFPIAVGMLNSTDVSVDWTREAQGAGSTYIIERSADGERFEPIGELAETQPAGSTQAFAFVDPQPLPGNSYYRVYQLVDDEMTASSDATRLSRFGYGRDFHVFPNPTSDRLTISVDDTRFDTEVRVDVLTVTGRVAQSSVIANGAHQHAVDLSALPNGIYLVRFFYGEAGMQTVRVVKE